MSSSPHGAGRLQRSLRSVRHSRLWLLVVPLLLVLSLYQLPNTLNFIFSFTDWSSYRDEITFVGLRNFGDLLASNVLMSALRITLLYALGVTVFQNVLGLLFALALEKPTRSHRALRVLIFIPVLISPLAAGYIFKGLLSYNGVLNQILTTIAGIPVQIEWLGSVDWTIVILSAIHAWKYFGITTLIYLAGLAAIPEELSEAARIDGAGYWKTFALIRWRMLAPAFTVNFALTLIGALNAFDIVLATTAGGPGRSTEVFNMYIFAQFGQGAFGRSTAMGLVLFAVVVLLALPAIAVLRKREVDQ